MAIGNSAKAKWKEVRTKKQQRNKSAFHDRGAKNLRHQERKLKQQSQQQTNEQAARNEEDDSPEALIENLSPGEQKALKDDLTRLRNEMGKLAKALTGKDGVDRQAVSKALDAIVGMANAL